MSTLALEMMLRFYLALLKTAKSLVIWKKKYSINATQMQLILHFYYDFYKACTIQYQ